MAKKNKQQIIFEADIGGFKSNIKAAEKSITSLNSTLKLNKVQLAGNSESTELLSKRLETLKDKYNQQQIAIDNTRASYEKAVELFGENSEQAYKLSNQLTELQTAQQRTKNEIDKTNSEIEKQSNKFEKAGQKATEWGNNISKVGDKLNELGNKVSVLSAGVTGIATAGILYNAEIEKYTKSFETFLGDAKEAEKVVEQIKKDASKTPFDVTSLVRANQMLISTGENAQDTRETILALGDAVTATGGGNDELTRMASNLQQIRNAGKATSMDIRQFAYAGIDIYGLLAKYTGKNTEEVKDMTVSYDVLSKALKNASKEGGKYYNAMNKASDTLTGQVNQLKAEVKDMTGDLTKSLMPTVKDVVSQVRTLTKSFDGLSDSQKKTIVNIGLGVATAGPALKILGTTTSAIGGGVKAVGTLSQAIGVLKTGTESSNAAANSLAAGLKGIVSPAGLATAGIALFTAAVVATKVNVDKEYESLTKLNQELKSNNEARKSAIEAIENQRDADLAEINHTEELRKELGLLVDENGKVKDGYETRAKFILGELNKALGTEYSMTGNVIDNYQNLMSTIDDLIAKKKAQIILEANEKEYAEAIKNKDKLYKDYIKTQEQLASKLQRLKELQEESKNGFMGSKQSMATNAMEIQKLSEEINNLSENLNSEKETLGKYATEIENYQKNSELMLQGGIENYKKIEESVSTTQQNITKLANSGLNERLKAQIEANEQSKKEYALEMQYNEDTKNSIYATNVKKGQENLQALSDELIARTSTIGFLGEDEINAWKTLADTSYNKYKRAISKMSPEMQDEINKITGKINQDTSIENAMQELAQEANRGFNNNVDPYSWGRDLINLLKQGMTGGNAYSIISGAASKVGGWISSFLHFSVPDKGPLSDMDESMPDMIDLMAKGMLANKNKLSNSAQTLAKEIDKAFIGKNTYSLSDKIKKMPNIPSLENYRRSISTESNQISNNKYNTNNIIVQFYPQQMTDAEMNRTFNYIEKRYGWRY